MKTEYADCVRPLICLPVADDDYCTLMEDWDVVVEGWRLTVPKGVKTDGASIPRFLWRICGHPLEVPRVYAAVVHDWLYGGAVASATRADADRIYYLVLRHFGISWLRARTEYLALRACGWSHWMSCFAMMF